MKNKNLKHLVKEIRVPGGHAREFEMQQEQFLSIIDLEGKQVADFIAFNKSNHDEKLSPTHTRTSLLSLKFAVGDELRTNFRNPMFEVIEDTVGVHDSLMAACDERRYLVDYGVGTPSIFSRTPELIPMGKSFWKDPTPLLVIIFCFKQKWR